MVTQGRSSSVPDRVFEIPRVSYKDRIVEDVQYDYREEIVEVPEVRVEYKIVERDVPEMIERLVYKPVTIEREKVIEKSVFEYVKIPQKKVVEVPEVVEQVVIKEIPVPQYVEVEDPVYIEQIQEVVLPRYIPVGYESIQTAKVSVPRIKVEYEEVRVPIFAPMFVEVPVPVEQITDKQREEFEGLRQEILLACTYQFPSLANLEELGSTLINLHPQIDGDPMSLRDHWNTLAFNGATRTQPRTQKKISNANSPFLLGSTLVNRQGDP